MFGVTLPEQARVTDKGSEGVTNCFSAMVIITVSPVDKGQLGPLAVLLNLFSPQEDDKGLGKD